MQINTTVRFHLTPVGIVTIKNTTTNKYWGQDVGRKEPLYTAVGKVS
jgi:hypothetical protein